MKKLLTVEEVITLDGRGVIVMPKILHDVYEGRYSFTVALRCPDGKEQQVRAELVNPRMGGERPFFDYLCVLKDIRKEEVPLGTEIWIDGENL